MPLKQRNQTIIYKYGKLHYYVCLCLCVCVCERERERERETETETDRQTDKNRECWTIHELPEILLISYHTVNSKNDILYSSNTFWNLAGDWNSRKYFTGTRSKFEPG